MTAMQWSKLSEAEQAGQHCASRNCKGKPTHRFEAGGIGSVYCRDCMVDIVAEEFEPSDPEEWCEHCQGTGEIDCYCGGDLCVCSNNGTEPCPYCAL